MVQNLPLQLNIPLWMLLLLAVVKTNLLQAVRVLHTTEQCTECTHEIDEGENWTHVCVKHIFAVLIKK